VNYAVRFTRESEHDMVQIAKADQQLCKRITRKLEALQTTPLQGKPLVGNHVGERSLRVGAYRIVYEVWEGKRQVIILTVKHRRHVY
jgi:mRNA interferase RelE/StbE